MGNKHRFIAAAGLFGLIGFGTAGCSGARELPVAAASGKVVCEGQPLKSGVVQFFPISEEGAEPVTGRPGTGTIQPDGTFVLSTYASDDGAVVGKHRILVRAVEPEPSEGEVAEQPEGEVPEDDEATEGADTPLPCTLTSELTVEVLSGTNTFLIELADGGSISTAAE